MKDVLALQSTGFRDDYIASPKSIHALNNNT